MVEGGVGLGQSLSALGGYAGAVKVKGGSMSVSQ